MKLSALLLTGATVLVAVAAFVGTVLLAFPGAAWAEETITAMITKPEPRVRTASALRSRWNRQ